MTTAPWSFHDSGGAWSCKSNYIGAGGNFPSVLWGAGSGIAKSAPAPETLILRDEGPVLVKRKVEKSPRDVENDNAVTLAVRRQFSPNPTCARVSTVN